ncbi:amidohydrolase family protein [Pararobbsia alpina]|uniref:Atrazine chlorohydrolase n=1 Tax=Pararobbsia alpina TaxID=621374 RepID=A0A6S7BJ71_9BURK|nr:amidohydrolase [Pararobbsia alpina]CAB3802126.1 Atrazine chlorohydrolase [Pararobbsia alpina]
MDEQLLCADLILPMTADNAVIADGAILVNAAGDISRIGRADELRREHPHARTREFKNRVLMPGLVNTHCHSGLLRGTAEGLPVWAWLQQYIDPMHRVLNAEEAEAASRLCYAEALLSGTTTIVDMWRFMEGSARAADELGIRAVLVPYVAEHPEHDYFETLDSNEQLIRRWHGAANGRLSVWVGLEHMFYAVPAAWERAVAMSREYGVGLHTHSNESRFDVEETQRRYGMRPLEALEKFGLLGAHKVLLAHCVWLSDEEIRLMQAHGVGVAHNPTSNMKLASGAAPVEKLLKAGIAVGLGTDGEKENNNLDMFEEMKIASLLAKVSQLDAQALDAWTVCKMATSSGARALGMEDRIGTLESGKAADIIAVRTDTARMTPLLTGEYLNVHHNLVHAVQGGDVDFTMVAGRVCVEDGRLVSGDMPGLIRQANALAPALFDRRAQWLARAGQNTRPADASADSGLFRL